MVKLLLLAGGAVASGALVYLFMRWERAGREHWVVYLLLAVIVIDSALYANETNEPRGLFHPGSGSLEFRLTRRDHHPGADRPAHHQGGAAARRAAGAVVDGGRGVVDGGGGRGSLAPQQHRQAALRG